MTLTVLVAALALTLTGCGGGGDDAASADASGGQESGSSGGEANSMEEFQQCMADNGVDFGGQQPDGSQDGERPSIDQDAMQRAQEACGDLMPQGGAGGQGGPGGPGGGFDSDAIQAWTDCLADNGVEVDMPGEGGPPSDGDAPDPPAVGEQPDTPPDGERPDAGSMFGLDTSDPEVAAAMDACQDLQPDMGGGPSAGSGGSTPSSGEAS